MSEGLSPSEVGKEIAQHRSHKDSDSDSEEQHGSSRVLTIVEAALLAVVAVLAAYSGFASAKWATESSVTLAKAATVRNFASRADLEGLSTKINAWFSAYLSGNETGMMVAQRRFRPAFNVAFKAWIATDPFTNPHAPPGPTYMPQYVQPDQAKATALDNQADRLYAQGVTDGGNSDNYVRTTVFLATVLFLVAVSAHFRVRAARIGMIGLGATILITSVVLLVLLPKPFF
jgi:hypothetical protein